MIYFIRATATGLVKIGHTTTQTVSTFERTTFDGTRVRVEMVDDRAGAWVPQGAYLGSSSARVLSLFMGEIAITDAAGLPALLADCRRAKGSALALSTLHRARARARVRALRRAEKGRG